MKYIIGIDEVGRGPLAGPVTVCVVACESGLYKKLKRDKNLPVSGKDSKKLSHLDRKKYAEYLSACARLNLAENCGLKYEVIHVSNEVIDNKGISYAIKSAIKKGIEKLKIIHLLKIENCLGIGPWDLEFLLDGGLKAPIEFTNQRTIIKGDEKEKIIAWASILAKVSRDKLMCKIAKKYSEYGFDIHKGYGTRKHQEAIKKHGLSEIHRKSFCKKYL